MIPLVIKKVCPDCGEVMRYVETVEEHWKFCPGPIRLVYVDEGNPIGEVVDE